MCKVSLGGFFYVPKQLIGDSINKELIQNLNKTILMDGLLQQVKFRKKSIK